MCSSGHTPEVCSGHTALGGLKECKTDLVLGGTRMTMWVSEQEERRKGFEKKSILFRLRQEIPVMVIIRIATIPLNQSVCVFSFSLVISALGNLVLVLYQDFVSKAI